MQKSLRCKDSRLGFGIPILFGISLVILNFGITRLSLSPDEGNVLFQILDNGLQISTGLTVVLGGRSSGKSYTLDAINDQYEHAAYIRQFELLARDEEADKRRFDELLRRKGDSITQEFLQPFRNVIDNVQAVDLRADEREIETYLEMLKKSAAEVERQDAFAKAKLFSETLFDIKDLSSLKKLIEAVDVLISNLEYRELINSHIERKALLNLAISLRKKYISESQLASAMKCVNDIVGNIKTELSSRTTNTVIPEIDFYRILLNQRKIEKLLLLKVFSKNVLLNKKASTRSTSLQNQDLLMELRSFTRCLERVMHLLPFTKNIMIRTSICVRYAKIKIFQVLNIINFLLILNMRF